MLPVSFSLLHCSAPRPPLFHQDPTALTHAIHYNICVLNDTPAQSARYCLLLFSFFLDTVSRCSAVASSASYVRFSAASPDATCPLPVLLSELVDKTHSFVKKGAVRVELQLLAPTQWHLRQNILLTIFSVIDSFPIPANCVPLLSEIRQWAYDEAHNYRMDPFTVFQRLSLTRRLRSSFQSPTLFFFWFAFQEITTICFLPIVMRW
jgi:hypothetical protein